jgi:hypothetical protein
VNLQLKNHLNYPVFEVYKIKPVKHKVYLATNEGIVVCSSERDNEQGLNQPLYFTSFVINGKKQEVKEKYHLKNNQNNISISFEALNYKTSIPIEYKYGLKDLIRMDLLNKKEK